MRLVNWDEFSCLPTGTMYQEYTPHQLGSLHILGEACKDAPDFVCAELTPTCALGTHLEIHTPSGFGRDGMHDVKNRAWLVWDKEDRERLATWLINPQVAYNAANNDEVIYTVPQEFVINRDCRSASNEKWTPPPNGAAGSGS